MQQQHKHRQQFHRVELVMERERVAWRHHDPDSTYSLCNLEGLHQSSPL